MIYSKGKEDVRSPRRTYRFHSLHKKAAILLCLLPIFLSAGIYEFKFVPLWRAEFRGVTPADLEGDGRDELIMSRKNEDIEQWGISITDIDNYVRWQYWSSNKVEVRGTVDIDDDGSLEIVVSENDADSAFLLLFSKDGEMLKRIKVLEGKDRDGSGEWDGSVGFKQGLNVDDDSTQELLLTAGTSYDLQPRGVLVYDPDVDEILWHYWTGFYPNDVRVADLDGDGDVEIVVGAASSCNGSEANGTDDFHTYVVVLDHKGQLLWQKQVGEGFSGTRVMVADFNGDRSMEIVVTEETHREGFAGPDRLMILDGISGKILKTIKEGRTYRGRILCDLDGDSIPEIIVGNSDGIVRAFDKNQREIASYKYGGGISISDAGDLDDDGHPEIIIADLAGKMYILNHKLKPIGTFKTDEGYQLSGSFLSDGEGKKILLQLVQPSGKLEYIAFSVEKKLSQLTKFILISTSLLIILLAAAVFTLTILYRRNKMFLRSLDKSSSGVVLLTQKGKVRVMNNAARDILGIKKDARANRNIRSLHVDSQTKQIRDAIMESICVEEPRRLTLIKEKDGEERRIEVQTFKAGARVWLVSLADVTEQEFGKRIAALMPVAQQLAHGIKNPLNNIKLALQRLNKFIAMNKEKQEEASRYSTMASEEAERLIKLTNGFMRFTKLDSPEFKPTSLKKIIKEVVDRFKQMMPGDVNIKVDCEETLPKLMLDAAQMSIVLDHLVDNAIAAVGGKGQIFIHALLRESAEDTSGKTKEVQIRVKDTGPGIPEKYKDRIFEPYFSLKEGGTGLGLCMAKKIVENHGGIIRFESSKGQGTTFIIRLPLWKE